jgi:hypothetical protein
MQRPADTGTFENGLERPCGRSRPAPRHLGPLVPVIDAILEADKTAPSKQRHTATRIFERLRIEHGFAGGYTVVKDYVRLARTRSREVFAPSTTGNERTPRNE